MPSHRVRQVFVQKKRKGWLNGIEADYRCEKTSMTDSCYLDGDAKISFPRKPSSDARWCTVVESPWLQYWRRRFLRQIHYILWIAIPTFSEQSSLFVSHHFGTGLSLSERLKSKQQPTALASCQVWQCLHN